MEHNNPGISCAFYTVKQLAALFGKSEDTIRRWKNEGVGKDEDNIKLRAVEREDGRGRKNARHLVFSRDAVIEFVKANPFLMDDAPQLGLMMQAEGAWVGSALPMPGEVAEHAAEAAGTDKRETGFMAQARRIIAQFEEDEREDEEFFGERYEESEDSREFERRCNPPRFGRRPARRVPPRGFGFDEDEYEDDEPVFRASDFQDPFEEWERKMENGGWRGHMPRGGRATRKAADEELQRRMKTANFALDVLRERAAELEKQRGELDEALSGLEQSGMDEKTAASIKKVLLQKKDELAQQKDMLEEFVEVIEEEMKD